MLLDNEQIKKSQNVFEKYVFYYYYFFFISIYIYDKHTLHTQSMLTISVDTLLPRLFDETERHNFRGKNKP